jgi:hypothetical protein
MEQTLLAGDYLLANMNARVERAVRESTFPGVLIARVRRRRRRTSSSFRRPHGDIA